MASELIPVLVAFATANTGSKVVEQLSAGGKASIRALVRDTTKPAAQSLAALPNVTLVKGSFEEPQSIADAFKGVKRAFVVTGAGEPSQYDREVALIKAATDAGVEAIVRISTYDALISLTTTCVYANAHAHVEKYIEENKAPVIDVRPNWYMSNWLWSAAEIKATGKISLPIPQEGTTAKSAMVDTRDVAGASAALLVLPSDKLSVFLKKGAIEVHGPEEVSFADKAAALSAALGKEVQIQSVDPAAWVGALVSNGLNQHFAESFKDTVLVVADLLAPQRPKTQKTTPELLEFYTPKYTVKDWAKDNAAAFL